MIFGVVAALLVTGALLGGLFWFLHREMAAMHAAADAYLTAHPEAASTDKEIFSVTDGPTEAPATFILVHGSPGSWGDFADYVTDAELTAALRIVTPDRPGYGRSPTGAVPPSLTDQSTRLAAWAEGIPGKRYWLGHSFGASIVARLAMDRPDLVDGVILLAGAMDPRWEKPRWFHRLADIPLVRRFLPPELTTANDEALAYYYDLVAMESDWSKIQCPLVIVHAENDRLADFRHVAFARERLDPARTEVIALKDGDHFLPWNRHQIVVAAMMRMAGVDGAK
jgi:pimeloyl-ACP methyl ester carboxylesterase